MVHDKGLKLILIALLLSFRVYPDQSTIGHSSLSISNSIEVDVFLPTSILTYEPLVFSVTVSNHKDQRIYLPNVKQHLSPDDPRFMVLVKKPGSKEYETYKQRYHVDTIYMNPLPLEKGDTSFPMRIIALTGPEWELPFDKTGVYEIKVRAKLMQEDKDGSISNEIFAESEPMIIHIQEAQGNDAKAMALWAIGMTGAFTICESGQTYLGQEEYAENHGSFESLDRYVYLDKLRDEYPNTVYGQYARFFYAYPWGEHLPGMLTEREERAAVYRELVENALSFPLRDEALLRLAQSQPAATEEDKSAALALLDELMQKYPDSPVFREAEEMAARLRQLP